MKAFVYTDVNDVDHSNYEGWSKSFEPDVDGHKTVG